MVVYGGLGQRMGFKILFLLLSMIPVTLHAATIVNFGAVLCDPGQHMSAGKCVDMVQDRCPDGYYQTLINPATYASPSRELKSCTKSYTDKADMPDLFYPISPRGALVSFGPSLCGPDKGLASGVCQPYAQGRCDDGFYQMMIKEDVFLYPVAGRDECTNSYSQYDLPELLDVIYNGRVVDFGVKLCGVGQHLVDDECTSRDSSDCPENFYDLAVSDTTMALHQDSNCATGYSAFWLAANCASNQVQHNMCATLCDAGESYTGTGICAPMCYVKPGRQVTLNALGGITLPLYKTRVTSPSVNIETSTGDVCYGNLIPGVQGGTINVTISGQDYHITD